MFLHFFNTGSIGVCCALSLGHQVADTANVDVHACRDTCDVVVISIGIGAALNTRCSCSNVVEGLAL